MAVNDAQSGPYRRLCCSMEVPQMDPRTRPPEPMRLLMKHWHKSTMQEIESGMGILDFSSEASRIPHDIALTNNLPNETLLRAFDKFMGADSSSLELKQSQKCPCFEVRSLPGLLVYPSLLPLNVQIELLNKTLHRDLSNSNHKNNLNLHYDIPYPQSTDESCGSFFGLPKSMQVEPKDSAMHKPLTIQQILDRKLRWVTLGGQYDWTAKSYPKLEPPTFPADVSCLLSDIWPDIDAQAAIVNFYTPGDTLSVHRDVSEECDRGLVSISIGCDALFIVGNQTGTQHVTLRLRSGDAIVMSGESRFAWHAVPKVIAGTCPESLQSWPYVPTSSSYADWQDWLKNKRININVRQMRISS